MCRSSEIKSVITTIQSRRRAFIIGKCYVRLRSRFPKWGKAVTLQTRGEACHALKRHRRLQEVLFKIPDIASHCVGHDHADALSQGLGSPYEEGSAPIENGQPSAAIPPERPIATGPFFKLLIGIIHLMDKNVISPGRIIQNIRLSARVVVIDEQVIGPMFLFSTCRQLRTPTEE